MSSKRKETEAEMEVKRKSILDIPEWFEKDLLNVFSELPDEEMSNDINELFGKFKTMKNDITGKIESEKENVADEKEIDDKNRGDKLMGSEIVEEAQKDEKRHKIIPIRLEMIQTEKI